MDVLPRHQVPGEENGRLEGQKHPMIRTNINVVEATAIGSVNLSSRS